MIYRHQDSGAPKKQQPQPFSTCWLLLCDQSRDKKYTTCTSVDDPDCRFWCSTGRSSSDLLTSLSRKEEEKNSDLFCPAENDGGFHRSATSLWAHCGTLCPPEESASEERCKGSLAHFYQAEFTGGFFWNSTLPRGGVHWEIHPTRP